MQFDFEEDYNEEEMENEDNHFTQFIKKNNKEKKNKNKQTKFKTEQKRYR